MWFEFFLDATRYKIWYASTYNPHWICDVMFTNRPMTALQQPYKTVIFLHHSAAYHSRVNMISLKDNTFFFSEYHNSLFRRLINFILRNNHDYVTGFFTCIALIYSNILWFDRNVFDKNAKDKNKLEYFTFSFHNKISWR